MPQATQNPTPRASGWSPERRAAQAAAIKRWQPWANSTGPRSRAGKARASRNACKHGRRSRPALLCRAVLTNQRRLHGAMAGRARAFQYEMTTNELLADSGIRLLHAALLDGIALIRSVVLPHFMQKSCIFAPFAGKG